VDRDSIIKGIASSVGALLTRRDDARFTAEHSGGIADVHERERRGTELLRSRLEGVRNRLRNE
jgi:hypothetical protein